MDCLTIFHHHLANDPDPVALSPTMGVTESKTQQVPTDPIKKSARAPRIPKLRYVIGDDLEADSRTREFQELVTSLRAKAYHVAARVTKKRKRPPKPIPITLCQVCGRVVVCQPRATHLKIYCGDACRQMAKRKRDRFKAARMLTRMHPDEKPVKFWVVVTIINTDDPRNSVRGNK